MNTLRTWRLRDFAFLVFSVSQYSTYFPEELILLNSFYGSIAPRQFVINRVIIYDYDARDRHFLNPLVILGLVRA